VDPGRPAAAALTVVVLVAAVLAGTLAWRSRPKAEPVGPPSVVAGPVASTRAATAGAAPALVVAVTGRVRRPGVVTLPPGARVIDALRAAGGPLPGADLALLNLARRLADGELVVVGVPGAETATSNGPAAGGSGPSSGGGTVDLNTATTEQLDSLPGVGPVLAQRILDWRGEHGPFTTVDQLREVPGIGEAKFGQLRDRVTV
jgi:competence protein ComEA